VHAGIEHDAGARCFQKVRVGTDSGVAAEAFENHDVGLRTALPREAEAQRSWCQSARIVELTAWA
jgi:hypothetical protein